MKNITLLIAFIICVINLMAMPVLPIYFDIGGGAGKASTQLGGRDMNEDSSELPLEFSMKLGIGPLFSMPLYATYEYQGINHRLNFNDVFGSYNHTYNSFLNGVGLVYYPIPELHISSTVGVSNSINSSSMSVMPARDGTAGMGWNIAVAVDISPSHSTHGFMVGAKYSSLSSSLQYSNVDHNTTMIGAFVKYRFKHRAGSLRIGVQRLLRHVCKRDGILVQLEIPNDDQYNRYTAMIERTISDAGYRVVDRNRLSTALRDMEIARSRSWQYDRNTALQVGRNVAAKYIVTGNIVGNKLELKIIEVETGISRSSFINR
jgi:hypothetical protein